MKYIFLTALALLLLSTQNVQKVEAINFAQFQALAAKQKNDTLYVVNFWATWCKPCIEELPYFEQVQTRFKNQKVKVILMSVDFASELERVNTFVNKKQVTSPVYLLNAGNPNDWIDKVDPTWTGAVPATVCYKSGKKVFFKEGEFSETELESTIQTQISKK
jgi:thiol-disulfide isomerase/thioredoxin